MRDILRSSITYQGFGIGALEESDDHDIYGHNEKAEYDKYLVSIGISYCFFFFFLSSTSQMCTKRHLKSHDFSLIYLCNFE